MNQTKPVPNRFGFIINQGSIFGHKELNKTKTSGQFLKDLCNLNDFWRQKLDVAGKLGLLPEQKIITALCILAYSTVADQCDGITRMRASSMLTCLKKLCRQIKSLYSEVPLCSTCH